MNIGQGRRCRATLYLNAHQGSVKAQTKGTIEFEIDNLGRRLISVRWDDGFQMYVFPDEIELVDSVELVKSPLSSLARQLRQ
jgi:hypothetical protein